MKKIAFTLVAILSVSLCGCPDYSHQRSKPDYSNMKDTGEKVEGDDGGQESAEDEGGPESPLERRDNDEG